MLWQMLAWSRFALMSDSWVWRSSAHLHQTGTPLTVHIPTC